MFEVETAERVGVAGCVVGGRDGVGEGEGKTPTAGTVAATASPEAGDGVSPEAISESTGAGSGVVQATIVSRIRANNQIRGCRFVDMVLPYNDNAKWVHATNIITCPFLDGSSDECHVAGDWLSYGRVSLHWLLHSDPPLFYPGEGDMNERDARRTTLLLSLMGLLAIVVAGLVDFALYRLQLSARSSFEPQAVIILGARSFGALVVAVFLVAVAWLSLRTPVPTRPAGWLFLLLGLPLALVPLLFGLNLLASLPLTLTHVLGDHLRLAGAFLAVLGLVMVFQPGKRRGA